MSTRSEHLMHAACDRRLRLGADEPIHLAAVAKDEQRRNSLDAEASRRHRVFIDIQLTHPYLARHFPRQLFHRRPDHAAWAAPRRPEIQQHGKWRSLYF